MKKILLLALVAVGFINCTAERVNEVYTDVPEMEVLEASSSKSNLDLNIGGGESWNLVWDGATEYTHDNAGNIETVKRVYYPQERIEDFSVVIVTFKLDEFANPVEGAITLSKNTGISQFKITGPFENSSTGIHFSGKATTVENSLTPGYVIGESVQLSFTLFLDAGKASPRQSEILEQYRKYAAFYGSPRMYPKEGTEDFTTYKETMRFLVTQQHWLETQTFTEKGLDEKEKQLNVAIATLTKLSGQSLPSSSRVDLGPIANNIQFNNFTLDIVKGEGVFNYPHLNGNSSGDKAFKKIVNLGNGQFKIWTFRPEWNGGCTGEYCLVEQLYAITYDSKYNQITKIEVWSTHQTNSKYFPRLYIAPFDNDPYGTNIQDAWVKMPYAGEYVVITPTGPPHLLSCDSESPNYHEDYFSDSCENNNSIDVHYGEVVVQGQNPDSPNYGEEYTIFEPAKFFLSSTDNLSDNFVYANVELNIIETPEK